MKLVKLPIIELDGDLLNFAVSACLGVAYENGALVWRNDGTTKRSLKAPNYCDSWEVGGPIIQSEGITLSWQPLHQGQEWFASHPKGVELMAVAHPLVAAMRCYVESKFGRNFEFPDDLTPRKSKVVNRLKPLFYLLLIF